MKTPRIIVIVRGGLVENVYSNTEDVDVDVLDYDNLEAETDEEERDRLLSLETEVNGLIPLPC